MIKTPNKSVRKLIRIRPTKKSIKGKGLLKTTNRVLNQNSNSEKSDNQNSNSEKSDNQNSNSEKSDNQNSNSEKSDNYSIIFSEVKPVINNNILLNPTKKYLFNIDENTIPISNKKYKIKKLNDLKEKLAKAKSKLDKDANNLSFARYWKEFDPFKNEKNIIATLGNTYNVSNAWIKCYELIECFCLIPREINDDTFIHFDNAAFPGSFILSVNHYINTMRSWKEKYTWIASSLLDKNEENKSPLEDKYGLYQNYKNNWLMTDKNNGDVLSKKNQEDFHDRLKESIDLYTSDLGFDVSSDYNNQELIQAPANIGQILTGLLTLKKGGSLVTKQYSIFEAITLSIMYATASFFDEFYICKPYSSREANSETYLVGKGFKGNVSLDHPYIQAMFARITKEVDINVPLFDAKDYPTDYIKFVTNCAEDIFINQINKLESDIERVYKCLKSNHKGNTCDNDMVKEFNNQEKNKIERWYYNNPIKLIETKHRLDMTDLFNQQIY